MYTFTYIICIVRIIFTFPHDFDWVPVKSSKMGFTHRYCYTKTKDDGSALKRVRIEREIKHKDGKRNKSHKSIKNFKILDAGI